MAKRKIIGIDEAGRGPLAGPVVAASVKIINYPDFERAGFSFLKYNSLDSKKLSFKKREEIYEVITKSSFIEYGVGIVSEKVIDKINILQATKLAMKRSLRKMNTDNSQIIIDGNFTIDFNCLQKAVVRADESILECSLASIIAKVSRDRLMIKYHKKYPHYRFDKHKGYGTKLHREMIKRWGICSLHRRSFSLF
jgi:ribonuclease HII